MTNRYDVAVVGLAPGGEVAATRLLKVDRTVH
jgi:pyruvate/2-oxoglutarate dehydrogenase complex dihydrolipoamide dehydrogenase (E3) component